MKHRHIAIGMVLIGLFLGSCTSTDVAREEGDTLEGKMTGEENMEVRRGDEVSDRADASAVFPAVNLEKSTVKYEGEAFQKSVFAAGGDELYVYGIKEDGRKFLGYMKEEERVFQEFGVDLGENMRPFNMALDEKGLCHILWMSVEGKMIEGNSFDQITYEKTYITCVREGRVESIQDVSDVFKGKIKRPHCFVVDNQGNYYFENESEVVKLSAQNEVSSVQCAGHVEGVGVGRSGQMYYTYESGKGGSTLEVLGLGRKGEEIGGEADQLLLPDSDAIYLYMMPGRDSELVLYNKANGVYIYGSSEGKVTLAVSGKELPAGEDIAGWGLLGDGRFCLMSLEEGGMYFYYLPTEGGED